MGGSSDPVPAVLGGLLAVVDEGVWGVAIDGRGQRPEGGLEDPGRHMTHKKRDGRGGVDRSIERNACVHAHRMYTRMHANGKKITV